MIDFNELDAEYMLMCDKHEQCCECKYYGKYPCQLAFGYDKGREDAIDEFKFKIKECCSMIGSCDFDDLNRIARQLKESNK